MILLDIENIMDKDIKKAVEAAEQELQDEKIAKIKKIVKQYLLEIEEKQEQKRKIEDEISLLRKDIDDFKAGRLDKIKERQENNPTYPNIIIIERVEKIVPYKPWNWEYCITPSMRYIGSSQCTSQNSTFDATGNMFATFSSGSYLLNDGTVNL